ncbi:MAG: hypothetical protein MZW92_70975 [Comamonadaceae bacterium]|nr:hypothetical protein [Comamonadaceae bacterium]
MAVVPPMSKQNMSGMLNMPAVVLAGDHGRRGARLDDPHREFARRSPTEVIPPLESMMNSLPAKPLGLQPVGELL